ncbi:MAG: ribonuclease E inhibitor RraB [Deltaproteobacteria bacterium]|nr:ribonuclease E inhibitor RraB [Deltaproteobacteria bacterium]
MSDEDGDAKVVDALRREGSDLSKPHEIDFFFDFSTEAAARKLCEVLALDGFTDNFEVNEQGTKFTCRAVKSLVPELNAMQALTRRFSALATQHGGVYDGWGTEVVD